MATATRHVASPDIIPKPVLMACGALLLFAVTIVALSRLFGSGGVWEPVGLPMQSREVRFEDKTKGVIAVVDHHTGAAIEDVHPGVDGFVRVALRGLARERRLTGSSTATPFRISRFADGRLTLTDLGTGRHIDLNAFGAANAAPFARFLSSGVSTP